VEHFNALAGEAGGAGPMIGMFYADFYFWVNLLSLTFQALLVSRLYRWVGVGRTLLVLPLVATLGYALLVIVPVFALVRLVKIAENSVDYSIQNTTRHALFLPVDVDSKYAGKTTIDSFFWRLGDLSQAGVVYVGATLLGMHIVGFVTLNLVLSLIWLTVAIAICRRYRLMAGEAAPMGTGSLAPLAAAVMRAEEGAGK
jgi:ATP:ADP antiporter, AAA family